MKSMIIKISALILCGYLSFSAANHDPIQQELSEKVVRLHILAEDNTPEAQTLKLKVRDAILQEYSADLSALSGKEQALSALRGHLSKITQTAQEVTLSEGRGETVSVSLEKTHFPEKTYGSYTFPAGYYDALHIVIGEGAGQNWWCVVYPPLCFQDICSDPVPKTSEELLKSQLTDRTYRAIALPDQPVIGFGILKWFRSLFD